ncbi:AAA family ATPase, partial [Oceanidesulfovibrio marinus]
VVLAAQTGKAAKGLEEVRGRSGNTIQSMLGYDGNGFSRSKENPIDADVLVVDEFWMVDVPVAWHLFEAVDLSRTTVLLVGDHNQLPPGGHGNILSDLIQTLAIPSFILEKVVREPCVLKENCTDFLKGEGSTPRGASPCGCRDRHLVDPGIYKMAARSFLLELLQELLDALMVDIIKHVQVLNPTD